MAATMAAGLVQLPADVVAQPTSPATRTVADNEVMHVNTEATFVRDRPDVRGTVVTRLERGARVEVLERPAGEWWRVRAGDPPVVGYVHRRVLAEGAPRVPLPTRPPSRPAPLASPPTSASEPADARPTPAGAGGLAFAAVGLFSPDARETFDAVGITGAPLVVSAGLEVTRVYRHLFVRGAVDWSQETGERVFLEDGGQRFPLGIPLDIRLVPIDVSAGWRFDGRPGTRRRLVPYVGGGAGALLYRESDPFAEGDEVIDETFASYHVLGGLDVYVHRRAAVRAEFRYRSVPGALGDAGVSAVTGETSLGGAVFVVGVVFGR